MRQIGLFAALGQGLDALSQSLHVLAIAYGDDAQFAVGALVDHFGWMGAAARPLNASRLAGMAVVLAGIWLIIRE